MPLVQAEVIFYRKGLDGPVHVGWGRITGNGINLVAVAGSKIYLFSPLNQSYNLDAVIDVGTTILSLAVGLRYQGIDKIILGTEDRVIVYGEGTVDEQISIVKIWEYEAEPGARFVDLTTAVLSSDTGETVIAASEGKQALYFYQTLGQAAASQQLGLLAIRVLPGPAQKVAVLSRGEAETPAIVAAYKNDGTSGLLTLYYTEAGFAEGPAQVNLPARVSSMTAGHLRPAPGDELVWGGEDGIFRIIEVNEELRTVLNSDNLGSNITALTAGKLTGEEAETLLAGTPEGYLFGYRAPVENSSPDWTVLIGNPVNDLAISEECLVGLGTADGGLQVWRLVPEGFLLHEAKTGETLEAIAAIYHTTVSILVETNRITNPDLIFPGQVLLIPQLP
ncbi:MAG: putative cell wall hydrolase LytN precursor [Pelotomaculum sp. PtaB.Bin013]|uniref:LysM peptidoglycan-binding domain-containing protein n=1 Tax=Pelotomaculum isophthalicicum JI TaxID=947010 RepID=A0A9X4JST0_9FIRM|nr:LysM domain-containing protein [Pelotomaculum isophthalicicum]MDF9407344.1 LysM peptidoglycan-binding domain-containing protein [Pelotomaculum isophthalicicum JI]OPX91922.1 MAG: putative cell wall hydrolase LytN precursor [Pelotomaculum sp. PtaB.Bin013]